MRQFVESFFKNYGGEVEADATGVTVRPSESLRGAFEQDSLRLVFTTKDLDERSELVTPGSPIMDLMHDFLRQRGQKLFAQLPAADSAPDPVERVSGHGCSVSVRRSRRRWSVEAHFNVKITLLSDEKKERLVTVAVDDDGRAWMPAGRPWKDEADPEQAPASSLTREQLRERFRKASQFLSEHIRPEAEETRRELLERLHSAMTRLKGYYAQQMHSISARTEQQRLEAQQELEDERDAKLRNEIENHSLRVVFGLINVLVLRRPVQAATLKLESPKAQVEVPIAIDLYAGEFSGLACECCGQETSKPAVCGSGHVACADCVSECGVCGGMFCADCIAGTCACCGAALCKDCAARCSSCNETVCPEHLSRCAVCDRPLCVNCTATCSDCGKKVCAERTSTCSVCGGILCRQCAHACARCGAQVCRKDSTSCAVCGQILCADCKGTCAVCGKDVCRIHLKSCVFCGVTACEQHFATCSYSGKTVCPEHLAQCPRCVHSVCEQLMKRCRLCQEAICPDCLTRAGCCEPCLEILDEKAPFATRREVESIDVGDRIPAFLWKLPGWRIVRTDSRLILSTATAHTRVVAVCDAAGRLISWRRFPRPEE